MFHGHGEGTDDAKNRILRYFHQMDHGLHRLLHWRRLRRGVGKCQLDETRAALGADLAIAGSTDAMATTAKVADPGRRSHITYVHGTGSLSD